MKISLTTLHEKLSEAAQKFVTVEEAEYFTSLLINTHLKKIPRTNPLKSGISDIESWKSAPTKKLKKTVDKPGATVYDCEGLAPSLKAKEIHEELITKARHNGIAMAAIINSKGFHTLSFWTDKLQEENLVAICMVNGGPAIVTPYGAKGGKQAAIFGSNPISYAIPTDKDAISADMAISQIAFFDLVAAKSKGRELPPNSLIDNDGNPTNNVHKSYFEGETANIATLGANHKGSALALLFEILTSSLVGVPNSIEMNQNEYIPEEHGNIIVAFDIASFTDIGSFKKSTGNLANVISKLPPRVDLEKVQYPGEGASQRKESYLKDGQIEITEELYEKLIAL